MVRTKNNFKPAVIPSTTSGDTLNDSTLVDGLLLVSSNSEKVTIDTLRKMDKLEQSTPFDVSSIPDGITNE